MGNTTKRTGAPIGPCPVDCKDIILEVDCSTYSNHTSYPMPAPTSPKGWKVNPHLRCDYTGDGKTKVKGTSSMINILYLAVAGLYLVCSIRSRISSIFLELAASISMISTCRFSSAFIQFEHTPQGS